MFDILSNLFFNEGKRFLPQPNDFSCDQFEGNQIHLGLKNLINPTKFHFLPITKLKVHLDY